MQPATSRGKHAPCGGAMLGKATHGVARIAQREVPRMLEEVVTDPDWKIHPGLPGRDYHAQDVWELEPLRRDPETRELLVRVETARLAALARGTETGEES